MISNQIPTKWSDKDFMWLLVKFDLDKITITAMTYLRRTAWPNETTFNCNDQDGFSGFG